MPTWAKVILVLVLVGILAVASLIGIGVYVWKQRGPQFVADIKEGDREGREFGEGTDNQECVDEGARRHRRGEGFGDFLKSGIFLQSCLQASRETPGFCEGVPGPLEFTKTIQWRREQCQKYGLTEAQQCGNFFQQVQQFCERRAKKSP